MTAIMFKAAKTESGSFMERDKVKQEITKAFNWDDEPSYWVNAEAIAEIAGLPKTRSVLTMIGTEVRKFEGVRTRRTNGARLILVPQAKI